MKVTRSVEVIKQQETFNNNIFDTIQRGIREETNKHSIVDLIKQHLL